MRLAIAMLLTAYVYLLLRVGKVFPHHSHSSVYFAVLMGLLTTANLIREWKDLRDES